MPLSLDKVAQRAPELLSLATSASTALESRNLTGLTAQVSIVLDFSGSMRKLYKNGSVQRLVNSALAFATQVDDDGEIDFFLFGTTASYLGPVSLDNFRTIVDDYTRGLTMGTTNYADAFQEVTERFSPAKKRGLFAKKLKATEPLAEPAETPALALFITDGAPNSRTAAVKELTIASYRPIFWQFLSIGEPIPFLQKLDDLDGRYIDNADYKNVVDVETLTEVELFDMLLDEYPDWVVEERKRRQIR